MNNVITALGFVGAATASCLFFPQVWASYKTKRTKDLAWSGILIGLVNGSIWIVYGVLKSDPFIYTTNAAGFVAIFMLFLLKRKYK